MLSNVSRFLCKYNKVLASSNALIACVHHTLCCYATRNQIISFSSFFYDCLRCTVSFQRISFQRPNINSVHAFLVCFFLLFLNKISGCSSSFLWFNGIESGLFKRLRELVYDSAIRYILMPFFVNFGMLWMLQSFNLLNFQVFNCNKTIYFVTDLVFLEAAFFVY